MKEIIGEILVGGLIIFFLSPYFCLWDLTDLKGIKDELIKIREELEKINK